MSLFEVEGWNLPSKVAGERPDKKRKTKGSKSKLGSQELQELVADEFDRQFEGKKKHKVTETQEKKRIKERIKEQKSKKEISGKERKTNKKKNTNEDDEKIESALYVIEKDYRAEKELKDMKTANGRNDGKDSKPKLTPLQMKMREKISGSRFRWINEQLYTISSEDALKLIKDNPELFDEYHNGFRTQVQSWPENPVDTFISQFKSRLEKPINAPGGLPGEPDGTVVIADMGCGEAQLAQDVMKLKGSKKSQKVKFKVHSFDLKKANDRVTVADIKNVPLPDSSTHVVVFCLALMGINFLDFIREANRILKPGGEIWIAEIKSRFVDGNVEKFVKALKKIGLFHKTTDDSNKMFVRFEFFNPPKDILEKRQTKDAKKLKFRDVDEPEEPEGKWLLKPCTYKRR